MKNKNPMYGKGNDIVVSHAAWVGAGATDATKATSSQFPNIVNDASGVLARTSIGLFTATLQDAPAQVLNVLPSIVGTEGLCCTVKTAYSATTKTIVLNIWDPGGSLDDPETTDTLVLTIVGRDSTG